MSQQTFTHRALTLALAVGAATAALGVGTVGCKQNKQQAAPAASAQAAQESTVLTPRQEALIAADAVISQGEKMKIEAERTGDATMRARGESHAAEGWRMHAEARQMK